MANLLDLPEVFRSADVDFIEEPGWQNRGTDGSFDAQSIMLHHDASPPGSSSGSADYIIANLLSQLWLSYTGVWHLIATGRMNHAGKGSWPGVPTDDANATFIGVETDHTTNEIWTQGQRQNGLRGLLALADWLGIRDSADDLLRHLIAHKEWAPSRKVDPDPLNMNDLRALILNPPTFDDGAPVETLTKSSSKTPRSIGGEWKNLQLSDKEGDPTGQYAVRKGPASWFNLTAQVYVQGEPGTFVQVRPWKDDSGTRYSLRQAVIESNGFARLDLAQQGSVDDGDWLRIEAWASAPASVTAANAQCATW
jgi:hypothetical protein